MPGERDLAGDGPDPVAVVGPLSPRRLHECGLGLAGLAREGAHRPVAHPVGLQHHGEAVPLERHFGEDVELKIGKGIRSHGGSQIAGFAGGLRRGGRRRRAAPLILRHMAKDTEKLIRQLSLISFLMAERRPVTALEIKQEVEGYSAMNDDAFARRFYADRAELDSLGIELKVEKPAEGYYEAENYSLPPENFYLPAIEFTDEELGALRMALTLLDGQFAYAEPLRLALQQLSWGRPSPLDAPEERTVALAVT